jgi:hypothetical protein
MRALKLAVFALLLLAAFAHAAEAPGSPWHRYAVNCALDKPLVMGWLQQARRIHAEWLTCELQHGSWCADGEAAWDRMWMQRYDVSLSVLQASTCHDVFKLIRRRNG